MTTSTDTPTTAAPQLPSATKPPLQIVGWLLTYTNDETDFVPGPFKPQHLAADCEEIAAVVLACDAEAYAQATAARQRALCDDAWDAVETLQRVGACQAAHHRKQRQALEAELSQHQRSEFHPDWSLLQATQESLREKMAEIQRLKDELANMKGAAHG